MDAAIRRFLKNTCGVTAIEYAVIASLISVMILVGVRTIGSKLSTMYFGAVAANL